MRKIIHIKHCTENSFERKIDFGSKKEAITGIIFKKRDILLRINRAMDGKERKEEEEGRREENILNELEFINYIILFMIFTDHYN